MGFSPVSSPSITVDTAPSSWEKKGSPVFSPEVSDGQGCSAEFARVLGSCTPTVRPREAGSFAVDSGCFGEKVATFISATLDASNVDGAASSLITWLLVCSLGHGW